MLALSLARVSSAAAHLLAPNPFPNSSNIYSFAASFFPYLNNSSGDVPADDSIYTLHLLPWERANAVAFSPDGKLLAVATSIGIHFYNIESFTEMRFIQMDSWARSVEFSPNGRTLAAGFLDHTVRLWRVADGALLQTLEGHTNWVRSVTFSLDGATLASVSDDNTVRLWRVADGTLLYTLQEGTQGVRCAAFSPNGAMLATGAEDGLVRLWNVQDGVLLNALEGHTGWVRTLAFSHDGQLLVSGSFDATARVWRVSNGVLLHTLKGHTASVLGVVFSPDDKIVITGSVDTTVRLWRADDGTLQAILQGHSNFIYDVDISPNGEMLASGAADSTVRFWDLSEAGTIADLSPQDTNSDCRVCHHPLSGTKPAAVIEVRCDACHSGGISLNWCPNFPRSQAAVSDIETYSAATNGSGVPVGSEAAGVTIITPGNGETIYSHYDLIAPLFVRGRVQSQSPDASTIDIRLEIWSGQDQISSLTSYPDADGFFTFQLGINPQGYMQVINNIAAPLNCVVCHDDYVVEAFLPPGEIRLVVVARMKDGQPARDERRITVDISEKSRVEANVTDDLTGKPVPGLSVHASARLYEWRGRTASAVTNKEGQAHLELETLSQASTAYEIIVPDQVIDGVYYSSKKSEVVVFPAGAMIAPSITFEVSAHRGEITGKLTGDQSMSLSSIPIWAFRLPTGPCLRTLTTQDGSFLFSDVPIAKYMLFPDFETLSKQGLASSVQKIDLTNSVKASSTLPVRSLNGVALRGSVRDRQTGWLPFVWLVTRGGLAHQVDIVSGIWMTSDAALGQQPAVVNAPGYYSKVIKLAEKGTADDRLDVDLQRRPETLTLDWGEGEIIIPPETEAEVTGLRIMLASGWLWGDGEGDQPLLIGTPETEIELSKGKFALERLPNQMAWLYLIDGQAEVSSKKTGESLVVDSGKMVALSEDYPLSAITYEPALVTALHPATEGSLSPIWQPTLEDRIRNGLAFAGISLAQAITFMTYVLALLSIIIVPALIAWRWFIQPHRKQS